MTEFGIELIAAPAYGEQIQLLIWPEASSVVNIYPANFMVFDYQSWNVSQKFRITANPIVEGFTELFASMNSKPAINYPAQTGFSMPGGVTVEALARVDVPLTSRMSE